ncbi:MAG: DNA polymerase III subunit gamma/tau [Candidatus Dojkabacteria bacterium]|jgi:DNA polymerase-3 subunit gamma/tau|nr:DNA polymerase III subunit gamma/tau [Candidatus Dojkabacteria bacterium]MDD2270101.1 DNA polymerase III subunit gamma/tau [Candidatus Dojkabacteria bacterium]
MSSVLYRKYRSQNFEEIIGQEHVTKILKNAVKGDMLTHAYLFVGSRGTGKTTTARILAKAINCESLTKDGNPCGKCRICKSIDGGTFLDLIEIDAASNRGIDQIRELKEKLEFSPTEGKYKIYIIDEVHMLTTEAFNALLKTLEEPPEHVIFILATTEVHKLPATILSRCQRYDFRLGTDKEIEEVIDRSAKGEGMKIEDEAKKILVNNARGSYRDALSLLDVVFTGQSGKDKKITESEVRKFLGLPDIEMVDLLLTNLVGNNPKEALQLIEELEEKGVNFQQYVAYTLEVLREALVAKIKGEELEYQFFSQVSQKDILRLVKAFLDVERGLKGSGNQSLVIEMVIPEFCTTESGEEEEEEEEEEDSSEEYVDNHVDSRKASDDSKNYPDIDFKVIKKEWKRVAIAIKPVHKHLYAFLETSKPIKLENRKLHIEVPFQFYKDQIECPQSREAINKVLKDIFAAPFSLVCTVNEKAKPRMKTNVDVVLQKVPKKPKSEQESQVRRFKPKSIPAELEAIFEGM